MRYLDLRPGHEPSPSATKDSLVYETTKCLFKTDGGSDVGGGGGSEGIDQTGHLESLNHIDLMSLWF